MKITFNELNRLFKTKFEDDFCIEVLFSVLDENDFNECCMGKSSSFKEPYWFGLSPEGKLSYSFNSFDKMCKAAVFNKKCLKDIIDKIDILEIDGCEPKERLTFYIESEQKQ